MSVVPVYLFLVVDFFVFGVIIIVIIIRRRRRRTRRRRRRRRRIVNHVLYSAYSSTTKNVFVS